MEHFENNGDFAGLNVNSGVEQQPSVNPYLKKRGITRRRFTAEEYAEGILIVKLFPVAADGGLQFNIFRPEIHIACCSRIYVIAQFTSYCVFNF